MADQAKITSIEALETFRSSLIIFLNKAHTRIDEVGDEIRRMRMWIQNDQRLHWESEIRKRRRALDLAEQELMTAKLSNLRDNNSLQMLAVRRARQTLAEAEDKLKNVRRWSRDFELTVEPLWKKLESLRGVLDHDLPKGVAYLLQTQKTLEDYMQIGAQPETAPAAEGMSNEPLPETPQPSSIPPS